MSFYVCCLCFCGCSLVTSVFVFTMDLFHLRSTHFGLKRCDVAVGCRGAFSAEIPKIKTLCNKNSNKKPRGFTTKPNELLGLLSEALTGRFGGHS